MYLKFRNIEDKLLIDLIGELDHHSAEEVRVKIDNRIERDNIKKVILNFRQVTFMDSSGIGVVVGRHKKVHAKDGILCVTDMNDRIKRVFELSGLFKIIKSFENDEEALNSI